MNSAISYLRLHYSPIVKFIFFFIQVGPTFFFSLSFSFPFLPYLTISLLSLSLYSTSLPPSPTKPKLEHQIKPISFFILFTQRSLSALSFSLLSLCFADERALPIVGCRWLWFGDCGHGSWVRWLWSNGDDGGFFFSCVVLLGSDCARPTQNDMLSNF